MNSTYRVSTTIITPKFPWPVPWERLKPASKNISKENDHGRREPSRGAADKPGIDQPASLTAGRIDAASDAWIRTLQQPKKQIDCHCGVGAGCWRVVLVALSQQL